MKRMMLVDFPDKRQKVPHYEHRVEKLDHKNNEFSSKKFQEVRNISSPKKITNSIKRIGMCLNNRSPEYIPTQNLNKVCFIIINDYDEKDKELGVGPLNDGYLVALKHHRLEFKIFYLYNSRISDVTSFLNFFMKNTTKELTIFYSGRDENSDGVKFNKKLLSKNAIQNILSQNTNHKARIMFITDCLSGGSIFDLNGFPNAISFSVKKKGPIESKEIQLSHGIFTYYFCKITSQTPSITPNKLIEMMNPSLHRFNEIFACELSNEELGNRPIFY